MANPWKHLKSLLPDAPLLIGTVEAHLSGDLSSLQLLGGGVITARGQSVAVGHKAFVRNGLVEGNAPDLEGVIIEV